MSQPIVVGLTPALPRPLCGWSWWTAPVRAERLAALRIGMALVLLWDILFCYLPQAGNFFGSGSLGGPEVFAEPHMWWRWSVLRWIDDPRILQAALILWAVAAVSLVAVVQVATCTPARYDANPALPPVVGSVLGKCRRAHGFFSIYMTLAGVLTVVLTAELAPLAVAGRRRAVAAAAWLTAALALALTLVRGAWLGLAAGVLVSLAGVRRRAVAVAGVVALAAAVLALPSVRQRAETLGDAGDATARERLAMIDGGLAMLRQRPIIGVGPGQVKRLYPAYAPPEAQRRHTSHLHNTPLQIAVERGVVGLALWLWIFAAFFARAWRVLRRVPADAVADRALVVGALAAVTAFLVAGLFEYNFGDTEVLLVILSVMALPFVVERDLAGRPA